MDFATYFRPYWDADFCPNIPHAWSDIGAHAVSNLSPDLGPCVLPSPGWVDGGPASDFLTDTFTHGANDGTKSCTNAYSIRCTHIKADNEVADIFPNRHSCTNDNKPDCDANIKSITRSDSYPNCVPSNGEALCIRPELGARKEPAGREVRN